MLAAMKGQAVDYVPSCFWWHFPAKKSKGEEFIKAQLDFYREMDLDFLKIFADGYMGWPAYVDHLDIPKAREVFGGRCLWGGFDNRERGI